MIGRIWRGWARDENAGAYEELFRELILPGLREIDGFVDAYVLRRDLEEEAEIRESSTGTTTTSRTSSSTW